MLGRKDNDNVAGSKCKQEGMSESLISSQLRINQAVEVVRLEKINVIRVRFTYQQGLVLSSKRLTLFMESHDCGRSISWGRDVSDLAELQRQRSMLLRKGDVEDTCSRSILLAASQQHFSSDCGRDWLVVSVLIKHGGQGQAPGTTCSTSFALGKLSSYCNSDIVQDVTRYQQQFDASYSKSDREIMGLLLRILARDLTSKSFERGRTVV